LVGGGVLRRRPRAANVTNSNWVCPYRDRIMVDK
jgi:hypothetical protein